MPAISQLKTLRNSYQREYEKNLKKDWVELREEDKFLHYEEIQQVLKELLNDFLDQQADANQVKEHTASKNMVKKARQLQKVYTYEGVSICLLLHDTNIKT